MTDRMMPRRRAAARLPDAVRRSIVDHASRDAPRECCGLLVGRGRTVVAAVPTMNLEAGETRFRVNELEHLRLRRAVRLVSPPLEVIGVYHSHPAGRPRPSVSDVNEAYYPEWLYVVVGVARNGRWRVRGFDIRDGAVKPAWLRRPGGD